MRNILKILNVCKILSQSSKPVHRNISVQTFKMGKTIPDRWLDYSKIGNTVEGTSFVPFKVPLHERICKNLPENARLTTRDIIKALPNVGLVINLTNTQTSNKYYDPYDWKSCGIDYKWIKVEGHVTPSQHLLVQFCHTVKQFLNANPSKLIGIHCTHGLNRTGYFVCSYMVLISSISPNEAIKRFAEARGHEIERENYINTIKLHDSNSNLKLTANILPVLIPKTQKAIKRSSQTEIDDERYDDRKRRNFNSGAFSKSDAERSQRYNNHDSSRNFLPETSSRSRSYNDRYRQTNDYRQYDRKYDSSYRPQNNDFYKPRRGCEYRSRGYGDSSRIDSFKTKKLRRSRWDTKPADH